MNCEENTPTLVDKITAQLNCKEKASVFEVYWGSLLKDIHNLAKAPLETLPNAYVYLYSVPKMYLQGFSADSTLLIDELYEFFHVVFNCLFNDDRARLSVLIQKDNNIEGILLSHFKQFAHHGKTPKYIFDILLLCLKVKDQQGCPSPQEAEILTTVLQATTGDDDFIARKSQSPTPSHARQRAASAHGPSSAWSRCVTRQTASDASAKGQSPGRPTSECPTPAAHS